MFWRDIVADSFPDKNILCSTTSPTTELERCKESVWAAPKKWPLMQQDSDSRIGLGQKKNNESRPTSQFAAGEWDKLASVMMTELITSKHLVFKFSNMLHRRILNVLQKRATPPPHARTKEQAKQPPEPTQQELVVIASEEAGFSKTVDVCQLFRTRVVCDARGRSTAVLQVIYQTKSHRRIQDDKKHPWTNEKWSRSGRFRLRG